MNQDQKYFHTLLNQAIAFDDAPGECQEGVWSECLVIIRQAGDRAARLGLPQIVEKTRRFKWLATPGEAKAIIAECLAMLDAKAAPTDAPLAERSREPKRMLTVDEAAARLNLCTKKVYAMCRAGELPCVRAGRAVRIPTEQVERFEANPAKTKAPPRLTGFQHF